MVEIIAGIMVLAIILWVIAITLPRDNRIISLYSSRKETPPLLQKVLHWESRINSYIQKHWISVAIVIFCVSAALIFGSREDSPQLPEGFIRQELPSYGFSIAYPEQWNAVDSDSRSFTQATYDEVTRQVFGWEGSWDDADLILFAWNPNDPTSTLNVIQGPQWTTTASEKTKNLNELSELFFQGFSVNHEEIRILGSKQAIIQDSEYDVTDPNLGWSGIMRTVIFIESSGLEIHCDATDYKNGTLVPSETKAQTCLNIINSFAYID